MKITRYLYLIFIIALYVLNYFYLKISILPFTGIVLGVLIVLIVGINIYVKLRDRKKGLNEEDFIFPKPVAEKMKTMDIGIQYEASMISLALLIIGLILFSIYIVFIAPYSWIMKGFTVFNTLCALVLMSSMLVTNYQQFKSYKDSTKMLSSFANTLGTEVSTTDRLFASAEPTEEEKKEIWDKVVAESKSIKEEEDKVIDFTDKGADQDLIEKLFNKNNMKGGFNN